MYFEIEKEQFDAFIKGLPVALNKDWEISDKNDISDPVCKDYFIYDYIGYKFEHISMFIQKQNIENPIKHIVTIKPFYKKELEDNETEFIYEELKNIFIKLSVSLKKSNQTE